MWHDHPSCLWQLRKKLLGTSRPELYCSQQKPEKVQSLRLEPWFITNQRYLSWLSWNCIFSGETSNRAVIRAGVPEDVALGGPPRTYPVDRTTASPLPKEWGDDLRKISTSNCDGDACLSIFEYVASTVGWTWCGSAPANRDDQGP